VLGGTPLEDCVVETCFPNVSVLPVGRADGQDFERLSPIALARVLDQCRERYDTVLVDTGPIVGSLEASFVAAKAHEVILVVRRGEVRTQVDEAIARLEQVGARIAGVVFNRASAADVVRSKYASGSRSTKESAA
jgi:tyrosine-protein kinase Etk/Wzc